MNRIERQAVEAVANLAPWLAPLPTAWLVFERTQRYLGWPMWVSIACGLVLETLGIAIFATALQLYDYNESKRKSDPRAAMGLPVGLIVLYFVAAMMLTFVLDVWPPASIIAPALFPPLSVAAFALIALRAGHSRRLAQIERQKKQARATRRQQKMQRTEDEEKDRYALELLTKTEQVQHLAAQHPDWISAKLAREVGCSPSTVTRALNDNGREEPEHERQANPG